MPPEPVESPPAPPTAATPPPEPVPLPALEELKPPTPKPAPAPAPAPDPLPALDESDVYVRKHAAKLSSQSELANWLRASDLLRRFVVIVNNVAEGVSPTSEFEFLRPGKAFSVTLNDEDQWVTSPKSYQRYDIATRVIGSIDVRLAAALFDRFYPLLQEAYVELGIQDREFRDTMHAAIQHMLETPVPMAEPVLIQQTINYEYADPLLEGSTPAQRQLLRMGPNNARKIKDTLRALQTASKE